MDDYFQPETDERAWQEREDEEWWKHKDEQKEGESK